MVEEVVVREEEVERLSFFFATVEADEDGDDERKGKKSHSAVGLFRAHGMLLVPILLARTKHDNII